MQGTSNVHNDGEWDEHVCVVLVSWKQSNLHVEDVIHLVRQPNSHINGKSQFIPGKHHTMFTKHKHQSLSRIMQGD
jgi:hypothetical protein